MKINKKYVVVLVAAIAGIVFVSYKLNSNKKQFQENIDFAQRTIRFMSAIKDKYDFEALNTHHVLFTDLHKAFDLAINNKDEAFKVMLKFD
jgi:threonine dehydrogenase-like Zn-dependent dehydrogenase